MVGWIVLISCAMTVFCIHVVSEWLGRKKHYSSITKYPQSKFAAYAHVQFVQIVRHDCKSCPENTWNDKCIQIHPP
jgi:hypothetical protein